VVAADAVVGAAAAFALEAVVVAPVIVKPQPQEKEADYNAIKCNRDNHRSSLRLVYFASLPLSGSSDEMRAKEIKTVAAHSNGGLHKKRVEQKLDALNK